MISLCIVCLKILDKQKKSKTGKYMMQRFIKINKISLSENALNNQCSQDDILHNIIVDFVPR